MPESAPGGICYGGCLLPGGVSALGGCLLPGGSAPRRGVCSQEGCLLPGGVSALGGVCSWGVSAPGGCLLLGGVCSQGGVCSWGVVSQHALRQAPTPPPPVNRITDTSKNITLATTSLRPVKTLRVNKALGHHQVQLQHDKRDSLYKLIFLT